LAGLISTKREVKALHKLILKLIGSQIPSDSKQGFLGRNIREPAAHFRIGLSFRYVNYSRILVAIGERDYCRDNGDSNEECLYVYCGREHLYPLMGWLIKYWRVD